MNRIWAVVEAGDASVAGLLAGEALRNAATARGRPIEIEVRTQARLINDFGEREPAAGDVLLVVADADREPPRFPGVPRSRASLAEVLGDATAVLDHMAASLTEAVTTAAPAKKTRIVAVTSCPTGIAHTFMAAEGLQQAAKALGHDLRVETQGSVGARDELTAEEIAAADLVVLAADREVDRARFGGKRVFSSGTKVAINDGKALLARALAEAEVQPGGARPSTSGAAGAPTQKRERTGPYKHLMTGVSFMLPFIVAGGLMIALAFAIGGIYADKAEGTVGHTLYLIGAKGAFTLIVPALAGYIAFSIADRPGIAPGMVGGVLAANLGAGFLGGIVAGFIAGYGTSFLGRVIRLPKNLDGLKPVLILPVLGTLLTGLCMIYAVGAPAARLLVFLTSWLEGLQGSSAILLGLLLGGMMAVDMGGPINKAAYTFSTGLIASHVYTPMAAVMVAGMAPPLALALATRVFANRFTHDEREAGGAAAVLGLAFITEGAIPFAARDPFRVLPALVCGSSVAGAIAMSAGVELRVPHGGAFVLPIPGAVTHLASCVLALVAGIVVSTALLGVLKKKLDVTEG